MAEDQALLSRIKMLADRIAIEDVVHGYAAATDTLDASRYAAAFAEDAIIRLPNGMVMSSGRDQIAQTATTNQERFDDGAGLSVMRHIVTNLQVNLHGDQADARYYVLTLGQDKAAGRPDFASVARYEDKMVRRDGNWMIQERVMHYDWGNDGMARALQIGPHTPEKYRRKP